MIIQFHKYEGTGNDFIMIDNRNANFKNDASTISRLCDRKFGIGADGLILLNPSGDLDFAMAYFNADGQQAEMCANGGRCIIAFAHSLGIIDKKGTFSAPDGLHSGLIEHQSDHRFYISLEMSDVSVIQRNTDHFLINTGVPHYIKFVSNIENTHVLEEGRKIRNSEAFKATGINVDFCQISHDQLLVRTYERGVEDETLSCGTGVTAASIAAYISDKISSPVMVKTPGGELKVSFEPDGKAFKNVFLSGAVSKVFQGEFALFS